MRRSDLEEFHRQYLCHPWQFTDEMKLRALAWEYHYRTEEYDQTVCSYFKGKIAIPTSFEEAALCSDNAKKVFGELSQGFSLEMHKKFRQAIQDVAPLFEQEYE